MKKILFLMSLVQILQQCPGEDFYCGKCIVENNVHKCALCYHSILKDGKCVKLEKVINNCLTYNLDGNCKHCYHGYVPFNNECKKLDLSNCIEVDPRD